jgi:hypothetical protein
MEQEEQLSLAEEDWMKEPSWWSLRHGAFDRDGNGVLVVRLPVLVAETLISSGRHGKIPAKHTKKRSGRILKAYGGRYKI